MFKFAFVPIALIACTTAESGLSAANPLTYSALGAVVAVPFPLVTATNSQVIARDYNGIAAAPIVAAAPVAAPFVTGFAAAAALPAQLRAPHYVAPFAAASLFW